MAAVASGSGSGSDPPPPSVPSRLPAQWDPATIEAPFIKWLRHILAQIAYGDPSCVRFSMDEKMLRSVAYRLFFYVSETMRHAARWVGPPGNLTNPFRLTTISLRQALVLVAGWSITSTAFISTQNVNIVRGGPPRRTTHRCTVVKAASLPCKPRPTGVMQTMSTELLPTVNRSETQSLLERSARLMPTPTTERGAEVFRSGCTQSNNELTDALVRLLFSKNNCSPASPVTLEWFKSALQYLAFCLMAQLNSYRAIQQLSKFGAFREDEVQAWVDQLPTDLEAIMRLAEVHTPALNNRDATGPAFLRALPATVNPGPTVPAPVMPTPAGPGGIFVGAREFPEMDSDSDSDSG